VSRYEEEDLSRIRPESIEGRPSKLTLSSLVDPSDPVLRSIRGGQWLRLFPDLLAGRSFRRVVDAMVRARQQGRRILWMSGAHPIKCGLGRLLRAFLEEGYLTSLAVTGSAVIHELELAFFGKTSEDVARQLPAGRFGMSRETAERFAEGCRRAEAWGTGLGEGMGRYLVEAGAPHAEATVLAKAWERGVPVTVHLALGTDIVHMHPDFPVEAAARLSMRDFRVFCRQVGEVFDRGAVLLVGSAVVLPEVFLKAVSIQYHLGRRPEGVVAAAFDMIRHYRVVENVLKRPFPEGGEGHYLIGHHEILLPLLYLSLPSDRD
jgi:hypothetical protein